MKQNLFWEAWPKPQKLTYLVLLVAFALSIIWMAFSYFKGHENTLDWNILAQGDKASVVVDEFKVGPFNLTQTTENTIYFQKYAGTAPAINTFSYYAFLATLSVVAILTITIISSFSGFWYYVGVSIFAFFLSSLKFELLLLFGEGNKVGLIIALVLFLPLSYFFHSIRPDFSILKRFGAFAFATILFAGLVQFASDLSSPFLYLSTSFTSSALVLSIIFIFIIAHEIIALFVYILYGQGLKSVNNGFGHLMVISVIYLVNVALALLYEIRLIDWDFLYINVFLLLVISAILGIWGFRQQENQYEFMMKFSPQGAILYLIMGIGCFVTIAHFQTTGNDPGLEVFRDFILYSHVGFGLIFLFYIIANFGALLKSKVAIYKVLYKPTSMPFFTFRFGGLIIVIALILRANWQVPVFQSRAAYFNGVADVHYAAGDPLLAERYYLEAANHALNGHKANYALGKISEKNNETVRATVKYKAAITKNPSPYAYVNLTNLYLSEDRFFDALFNTKEAAEKFPNNPEVLNTLGLLYGKTNIIDSAIFYLDKAAKISPEQGAALSNIFGLLAKNDLQNALDSALSDYQIQDDPISSNNLLVVNNKSNQYKGFKHQPADSTLSAIDATLLNNQSINNLFSEDSVSTKHLLEYSDVAANATFKEGLEYVACLGLYKNGDVNTAFRKLNWLANSSEKIAGKYFDDIGLWALDQQAYGVAIEYFNWSLQRDYEDAKFHLAIAFSENQNIPQAIEQWQALRDGKDESLKPIANQMISILTSSPSSFDGKENELYLYTRYVLSAQDTTVFKSIVDKISSPEYKAQAILDMANKLWKRDWTDAAVSVYSQLADLELSDQALYNKIQHFELKMLAEQGNIRGLAQKVNQGITFSSEQLTEREYYKGLISEASGDTLNATKSYDYVAFRNPFFVEAVVGSARYFNQKDAFKAYHILLNALEVNPRSIKLLKAYILQCAEVQQNVSGEIALEALQTLVTQKEFKEIENQYFELVEKRKSVW